MMMLVLPLFGAAQPDPGRLFLGLNLSGSGFSHIQGASPTMSPELRARWQFSDASAIEAAASIAEFRQDFDTPGGISSLPLQSWWVEVGFSQRILAIGNSLDLLGNLGGGITSVHHPDASLPLGALGSATIPAATDSRPHITSGIRFAQGLFEVITLNVGTNIRFLSPFSGLETGYSVFGGFSVEVL